MNRAALLTVVMALALAGAVFAGDDKQSAEPLIQKAVAVNDLLRPGVPHTIHASFEFSNLKGKPTGTYDRVFVSPTKWIEVIRMDKYSELTVVKDGQMWKTRPEPYDNDSIRALHIAMDPLNYLEGIPNREIESAWKKKIGGTQSTCVKYKRELAGGEICMDPERGQLLRTDHHDFETVFSDRFELGAKFVPKFATVKSQGNVIAKLTIETVSPTVDPATSFEPPATGTRTLYCSSSQYTVPIGDKKGKIAPHYPEQARQNHVQGTVVLAVVVQADGVVRPLAVLQSSGKALDEESWRAISQWRYIPATCEGKPIEFEERISVHYQLSN